MIEWIILSAAGVVLIAGLIAFIICAKVPEVQESHQPIDEPIDEEEEAQKTSSSRVGIPWVGLISGFVAILIGVSLIGPISKQVSEASNVIQNQSNITTDSQFTTQMLQMITPFFALMILMMAVFVIWNIFRSSGLP